MVRMSKLMHFFYKVVWKVTKLSRSFSSDGEDLILEKIFHNQNTGYYVDIGAYKPISVSNTFLFYLKGWRGVLIDPEPKFKFWANLVRRGDKVLNIGIDPSLKEDFAEKKMYIYKNHPDCNTISKEMAMNNSKLLGRKHDLEFMLSFAGVENIINHTKIFDKEIDLLSIDVEGLDQKLVESLVHINNIRPKVICVEQLVYCERVIDTDIYKTLVNNEYVLFSKTILSSIYIHKDFLAKNDSDYLKICSGA